MQVIMQVVIIIMISKFIISFQTNLICECLSYLLIHYLKAIYNENDKMFPPIILKRNLKNKTAKKIFMPVHIVEIFHT